MQIAYTRLLIPTMYHEIERNTGKVIAVKAKRVEHDHMIEIAPFEFVSAKFKGINPDPLDAFASIVQGDF